MVIPESFDSLNILPLKSLSPWKFKPPENFEAINIVVHCKVWPPENVDPWKFLPPENVEHLNILTPESLEHWKFNWIL